ncbi:hypothetical protein ACJX0J_012903, partial [Zea mays]
MGKPMHSICFVSYWELEVFFEAICITFSFTSSITFKHYFTLPLLRIILNPQNLHNFTASKFFLATSIFVCLWSKIQLYIKISTWTHVVPNPWMKTPAQEFPMNIMFHQKCYNKTVSCQYNLDAARPNSNAG